MQRLRYKTASALAFVCGSMVVACKRVEHVLCGGVLTIEVIHLNQVACILACSWEHIAYLVLFTVSLSGLRSSGLWWS